jgi:hypothetical protein
MKCGNIMANKKWFPVLAIGLFMRPFNVFAVLFRSGYPYGFHFFSGLLLFAGASGRSLVYFTANDLRSNLTTSSDTLLAVTALLIVHAVQFLFTWYIGSLLISKLAIPFGGGASPLTIWKITVSAYTPFMLVQPLVVIDSLGKWIGFAGLIYTYILFTMAVMQDQIVPKAKVTGFTVVSFFILLGTSYIAMNILTVFLHFI